MKPEQDIYDAVAEFREKNPEPETQLPRYTIRGNFIDQEDGLHWCDGEHSKSEGCTYRRFKFDDLKRVVEQVLREVQK